MWEAKKCMARKSGPNLPCWGLSCEQWRSAQQCNEQRWIKSDAPVKNRHRPYADATCMHRVKRLQDALVYMWCQPQVTKPASFCKSGVLGLHVLLEIHRGDNATTNIPHTAKWRMLACTCLTVCICSFLQHLPASSSCYLASNLFVHHFYYCIYCLLAGV